MKIKKEYTYTPAKPDIFNQWYVEIYEDGNRLMWFQRDSKIEADSMAKAIVKALSSGGINV